MSTASPADDSPRFTHLKLVLILVTIAATTLFVLAPSEAVLILSQLLIDGPLLLVWLGAAWGAGELLCVAWSKIPGVKCDGADTGSITLKLVTRIALGLGILSLTVLGIGSIGMLSQSIALLLILIANVPTARVVYRHRLEIGAWFRESASLAQLTLLPAVPIVAAMVLGALVIPWILWGDEPHAYDVVAYHFQLPREWLESGRIAATPHNVFGYFPLNVEMHYLLAMTLRGGATAGMYLAQLMHTTMVTLALAAIYGATRSCPTRSEHDNSPPLAGGAGGGRESKAQASTSKDDFGSSSTYQSSSLRASIAVVFAAAFPWMLMLGSVGYNEGGVILFTTLALAWMLRRKFLLAGVFAGLAAGCKITSLPTLVAVLPILVLIEGATRKRFEWRGAALLLLGSMLALSPWLVRNASLTGGNPVFPIAARSVGAAYFDAGMLERFEVAHTARPDQQTFGGRWAAFNEQVLSDFKFGSIRFGSVGVPVLLAVVLVALALRVRDRWAWMLVLFIVANALVWLFATHLQGRFLVPIIPAAALLVGRVASRSGLIAVFVVSVVSMPLTFASVFARLTAPAAHSGIAYPDVSVLLPEPLVKLLLSTNRPIYLLGDARAFLYPVPTARLHYRSVFDVSSTKAFKEAWLGEAVPEDALVVVVPSELARFERTYRNLPKMPDDWRGRPMFVTDAQFKTYVPVE